MKTKNIISAILFTLGIIALILGWFTNFPDGFSGGIWVIFIGIPLIVSSVLFFFSTKGATIFLLGLVLHFLVMAFSLSSFKFVGLVIIIIGLIYSLIEGLIRFYRLIANK